MTLGSRLGPSYGRKQNRDPSVNFSVYDDFRNSVYRSGAVRTNTLSALPGYAFTDSVDNVPNIDANGYTALVAQASSLLHDIPALIDADMLVWINAQTTSVTSGDNRALFELAASANDRLGIYVSTTGVISALLLVGGAVLINSGTGQLVTADQPFTGFLRRSAGVWRGGSVKGATVTFGPEATLLMPAAVDEAYIGRFRAGGSQADMALRGVFVRYGDFSTDDLIKAAIGSP